MGVPLSDILDIPKIDLHRHIDGSIEPKFLIKQAEKYGIRLPTTNMPEFKELYNITDPKFNIEDIFKRFSWAIAVMRSPEGIKEAVFEQVLELANENIVYAELRFAPGYSSIYPAMFYNPRDFEPKGSPIMDLDTVITSALNGITEGCKETGIEVNLILSIPRESHEYYGIQSAAQIADLAVKYQDQGVVAIDLACDELTYPAAIYSSVFKRTIGTRIRRDPHAGEMGENDYRKENIKDCIELLHADGLGHALPLYQDEELLESVKKNNIRIERNPLDLPIRGRDESIGFLLDNDVPISICSDDPALMRESLSGFIYNTACKYNWDESHIYKMTQNAFKTGFFRDEKQKKRVMELMSV